MSERSGIGYDSHRLVEGRRLILGGVVIEESPRGLLGHSDGDVLVHAVMDAVLGAAGLGDIGQHFPDTDERYAGADSVELLGEVNVKFSTNEGMGAIGRGEGIAALAVATLDRARPE